VRSSSNWVWRWRASAATAASTHYGQSAARGRHAPTGNVRIGYCPSDKLPDPLNEARHSNLAYPLDRSRGGVDYSYGIGVPLSAGGWAWRPGYTPDQRPRRFNVVDRHPSARVLAGDGTTTRIYNLSGRALLSGVWNDLTQYDNTVAWGRHATAAGRWPANLLFQDGHVASVEFAPHQSLPVNTVQQFVWYLGEPLHVDGDSEHDGNWYPEVPPPSFQSNPRGDVFPNELLPYWYTANRRWTLIPHK
jgi:prepilin-type processing-associated H-X9-DG protein